MLVLKQLKPAWYWGEEGLGALKVYAMFVETLLCLFRFVCCYRYCSENLEMDDYVC